MSFFNKREANSIFEFGEGDPTGDPMGYPMGDPIRDPMGSARLVSARLGSAEM